MKLKAFRHNIISMMIMSLLLTGCAQTGLAHDANFNSNYGNSEQESVNVYVCSDEVMFRGIDAENQILVFDVTSTGEVLSLSYDGTTIVTDQYSNPMTVEQLNKGDILNIAYSSSMGKVGAIIYSPDAFCYSGIEKYRVSENGQTLSVGNDVYSITPNTKVYSDGQEITVGQLINNDSITIQGKDHYIYSIRVDTGHGYLELENYDALIGGWIEIGQSVISQISDGMLFTVPEGIYKVHLTNAGIDEFRDLIILRNEIAVLDCSDIESTMPDKGIVSFKIFPEGAATYVDDEKIDTRYAIRLSVGIHEIRAEASGFSTVSQYINVDGTKQNVYIDLEESTNSSVSGNSLNKNLYATLTVEAPVGAEVYEDNIYKGVAPVSFKKTAGTHVLTFKKTGYVTTSYNVYMEDDGKDETMSFADLVEDRNTVSGNSINTNGEVTRTGDNADKNTVSGNSVSGNSIWSSPSPSPSVSPSPTPML